MLNFLNFIPGWKQHGTKILGAVTGVLGAVLTFTPAQLTALHISPSMVLTVGGILTFIRGFDNTNGKPDVLPPPTVQRK
ncbi:MAG: hypothetical protein ACREQ5_06155 [Candidatus Dormibacteria bacterium]